MHHSFSSQLRQIVAIAATAAIAFVGCSDDGTPAVTIDEDTYEDIGLAAADIASRGAIAPFLLIQLGYMAIEGPDPAIAGPIATRLPSAGSSPEEFCEFGTVTVEIAEDESGATVDYHACLFLDGPACYVDGRIELSEGMVNGESALEATATDLVVECDDLPFMILDGDTVACNIDGPPEFESCEIDLAEFEGPTSGATLRVPELEMLGYLFGGELEASGTGIDDELGQFDFQTVEELELDCNGLPSEGVILFGDESSGDYGSIEFDDFCEDFEICLWSGEEEGPPIECSDVPYPEMMLDL